MVFLAFFDFFQFVLAICSFGLCPFSVSANTFRKNYILERNESWGNGHVYLVREEQPFFRVYHPRHHKTNPAPPRRSGPSQLEFQLREEKGNSVRMRQAAKFWREHNRRLHQKNERRAKRALFGFEHEEGQNEHRQWHEDIREMVGGMRKEDYPEDIVDKEFRADNEKSKSSEEEDKPKMEILTRNRSRAEAKFGHHHLPKGEVKDSARWPWQIWPYMHCLTLECVCPLFRGTVIGHKCILPNGKPLKRAIRKDIRQYTREELALFVESMRRLKASGLYNRFGMIHRRSGVHSGPSFFPWHREFIKRLEIVFRAIHPENTNPVLGLPYWDSTLDHYLPVPVDSIMFSKHLMGEPDEAGFVTNGLFANWTTMDGLNFSSSESMKGRHTFQRMFGDQIDGEFINDARIDWVLSQTSVERVMAFSLPTHSCIPYEMDDRFLEYSHDYVHYTISGDMQERFSSSNDPIFVMHHGFIDSLWEKWRQTKQTRLQRETDYPRSNPDCAPEWHFANTQMPLLQPLRNIDALSNNYTDQMFEYAPRPSCARSGRSDECGNTEFLWCDTKTHLGQAVCSSKIKAGGSCAGFEWSAEVCFGGQCREGRCVEVKEGRSESGNIEKAKTAESVREREAEWRPTSFMRR